MKPRHWWTWLIVALCALVIVAVVVTTVVLCVPSRASSALSGPAPQLAKRDPVLAAAVEAAWKARPPVRPVIDAVVTWVDGRDAAWRAAAATAYAQDRSRDGTVGHAPSREPEPDPPGGRDELYYNVRSVARFMPWVRTYHVVTARPHVPGWWPADGRLGNLRLALVHHDQIAPAGHTLPTYSSGAIQRWIHRIPDLAEQFVLFDDDFFVGQPMAPKDFFTPGTGLPVVRMYPVDMQALGAAVASNSPNLWRRMCANTARAIQAATSARQPHFPDHVPVPCLRSQYGALVDAWFPRETAAFKRFRGLGDFTLQYALLGILHARGRTAALRSNARTAFYHTGTFGVDMVSHGGRLPHLFCIQDRMSAEDRAMLDMLLMGGGG